MNWITENWRMVLAVLAGIVWFLQQFGPMLLQQTRRAIAAVSPVITNRGNILRAWPLIVAAVLFGPMLIPKTGPVVPVEPPKPPDIVAICANSHRSLLADAVTEYAGKEFSDVTAAEDWINEKLLDCYEAAFEPLHTKIGAAKKAATLTDCAERIRKGDLND